MQFSRPNSVLLRPGEYLDERGNAGNPGQLDVLDLQILEEGERGKLDGMPASHARFLALACQRHGRAGHCDPSPLFEIDLMLQPCLPVVRVLDFVQQQELGPGFGWLQLAPNLEQSRQPDQFQQRVIERGVQDVLGRRPVIQDTLDGLQQQGRLADLPRRSTAPHGAPAGC